MYNFSTKLMMDLALAILSISGVSVYLRINFNYNLNKDALLSLEFLKCQKFLNFPCYSSNDFTYVVPRCTVSGRLISPMNSGSVNNNI